MELDSYKNGLQEVKELQKNLVNLSLSQPEIVEKRTYFRQK